MHRIQEVSTKDNLIIKILFLNGEVKEYDVKKVYYGHLHGASRSLANEGNYMGIDFKLISADHLGFKFWKIK